MAMPERFLAYLRAGFELFQQKSGKQSIQQLRTYAARSPLRGRAYQQQFLLGMVRNRAAVVGYFL